MFKDLEKEGKINSYNNFDNFFFGFITLLKITTVEEWSVVVVDI